MGRRLCWLSPCSVFNGCSPLPSSHRAKGGHGQGVSPALRSSSYRGSRKSLYFPHSLRQQKRMLEKRSSRGNCKDKGTAKVSRANGLSSEPPQAGRPGTPRGCSPTLPASSRPLLSAWKVGQHPRAHHTPAWLPFWAPSVTAPGPGLLFGGARRVGHPGLGC